MRVKAIPDGFHTVTPFIVAEDVPRLIEFLQSGFGAIELFRIHDPNGRVMHAQARIGDSVVMMGEAMENCPPLRTQLYLYVADADSTYRKALAAGGASLMEPAEQFWGDRIAGITDPAGNHWVIATHVEDVDRTEIAKRAQAYRGSESSSSA